MFRATLPGHEHRNTVDPFHRGGRRALLAGPLAAAEPAATDPNAAANAFFERALDERLELDPTTATSLGLKTGYDRWPDASEKGDAERLALAERQLAELRKFDPAKLDDATRLSWQVFEASEERRIARYRWRNHGYLFDKDGAQASMPGFLINTHRIESEADAVAYVRRLEGIRPLFAQQLERAAAAAKQGIAPPQVRLSLRHRGRRQHHQGTALRRGPRRQPAACGFSRQGRQARDRGGAARSAHRRGRARAADVGQAGVRGGHRLGARDEPDRDRRRRRVEAAGRRRLLRLPAEEFHDDEPDREPDPRHRPARGRAHPRRDARGHEAGRVRGRPGRVLRIHAHGRAVLLSGHGRGPRSLDRRCREAHRRNAREASGALRDPAEGRSRRESGRAVPREIGGQGFLPAAVARRHAGRESSTATSTR